MATEEKVKGDQQPDLGAFENDVGVLDDARSNRSTVLSGEDILARQDLDPALNAKMHLVNNAIDEIGWTNYHWKLFVLNGFGYAVDSLVLLLQSNIAGPAFREFGQVGYDNGLTISVYVGMLLGAIFWGLGADIVGRRWAFNISLFICSVATIVAGAAPNWPSLGFFIAMIGFGAGGNLILDTTVFLEYLPSNKQWALTFLACWWGVGQAVTGFICWGFLVRPDWNCESADNCPRESNGGWRYVMFTAGALVFVMSIARITVVRLQETPKYRLCTGEDAELVETLHSIAKKYNRPCTLTLEKLEACGVVRNLHSESRFSLQETFIHFSGLFATRTISISTILIWVSWTLIGLAYPLFYVFLNTYLASRGALSGVGVFETWRNYTLTNISGIFGPILAAWMCNLKLLGRRYTMAIGALITMAFFFAYTSVSTPAQNVGFSCAIAFCINIYYGTLYAYTPEVLPSAHRATGNGIAVGCNRIMGIISAVVASFADTGSVVPIYICAALFLAMAGISSIFPFEPYGRRSS
ncbi:MFS general substrate transporter [Durotheca rogersii]|uniref:MFS general substrate transporter n=1 Tax=Durotheca rogersii TaxID=419775 RepID=UPI00221FA735|nr:MFS general substrate transporter [Durotheca rogersii]KAI5863559.1 MFS general substrate transporter [Durotheca rogersii]